MGLAFEIIGFAATNPGAGAAAAAVTGDSLVVRNFERPAYARLEVLSRIGATAGYVGVRSPAFIDNVRGLRVTTLAGTTPNLLTPGWSQDLEAQDALGVDISGGAAEVDGGILGMYYSDLPGAAMRLVMPGDIQGRVRNLKLLDVAAVTGAAGLGWGSTVITTTEDLLVANTDFAVLGWVQNVATSAMTIIGPDTSNRRIGGPGTTTVELTRDWFVRMSEVFGTPHIPVFNSANKGATNLSLADVAGGTTVQVALILAELRA